MKHTELTKHMGHLSDTVRTPSISEAYLSINLVVLHNLKCGYVLFMYIYNFFKSGLLSSALLMTR